MHPSAFDNDTASALLHDCAPQQTSKTISCELPDSFRGQKLQRCLIANDIVPMFTQSAKPQRGKAFAL